MLKSHTYQLQEYKFRTAHAVAKKDKSFKDYEWMCDLDQRKGLDIGARYSGEKKCREFIGFIADWQRDKSLQLWLKSPFMSFCMDGSQDFMGEEMETIYIRTAYKGVISDTFMKIGSPDSTSSNDLHSFVIQSMAESGLTEYFSSRLVGLCADGASNMQGRRNGLAGQLIATHPEITVTHCLAHRMELAFKDSLKDKSKKTLSDLNNKAITLLMGLYYFYRNIAKQKKSLKEAFRATHLPVVLPTRVGGTRWVGHMLKAANVFLKGYKAFVAQLSSASQPPVNNAKAKGLGKLATDVSVLCFIVALQVINYFCSTAISDAE